MSLTITTRRIDDIVILDLNGRITIGEGSIVLRDRIRELLSGGETKFLLDLNDVDYVDSSGLGHLVSAFTTIRAKGGTLKLLNITSRIEDLLQITKLLTVFDSFTSETEAIKSFRSTT